MKNTEEKPNTEENVETSSETYSMLTNESKEDHSIVNEQIENSEENKEEKINNEEQVDTLSETNAVLINENKEEHLTANEETEEIKNPEENKEEKQIIEEHVEISNETNPMLTNKSKEEHLAVNEEKEQTKNIEENKEENVEQIQQTVTTNEIKNEEEVNKDEEEQNQNEQETNKEEGEEISKSEEVEQIKDEAPEKEEKKENEEEENKDAPKKKSSKKHSKSKKKEKIRVLDDKELFKVVMKFILTFSIEEEDKIKDVQNGYITAVLFVQWTMEYADIYTPILSTTMDKIREQKKTELEEAEPVLFQKFYLDVIRFARFNIMRINELAIISYAIHNNIEIPQIPFLTKHKKVTVFNKTLITDVWRAGFLNVIARKGYDYYRLAQRFSQIANAIQHSLDEKCPDSISYKLMKTYGDFMIEVQSTGVFTMKDTYEHTSSKIYKSIDFQTFEHLMSTIIIGFEINCEDFIFLAPKEAMYNTLYIVGMKQQIADLISLGCDDERMLLLKRFLMNSKPKMPQEISRCFKTKTFVTALHKLKEIVDELYAKVKPQKIKILKDVSDEEIMEIKRQLEEAYPPKTEKKPEPVKRRTRSSEKMKETQETQEKTTRRRTTTRVKQPEKKEKTPKEDEKMSDYYSYSSSSESEDQEPDKSESTSRKHITKKKLEVPKTFPWVVTSEVTIINLGSVCNEEKYSSSKYVFNPGYTALTLFYYYGDTSEDEVNYKCEIIKGDGRPIFRVTCEKDEQVSEGTTPSNAWRPFLKNQSVAHSGAALFGLSIPSVHAVLMAEKRRVEAEINEQSEIKKEKKKAPTVKPSSSQPVQREYNVESSKEPKLSFSFLPEAFEVGPVLGFDFHGITEEEFKAKLFDEDLE